MARPRALQNGNLKLILATVTSIAVAWIGASKTAASPKDGLTRQEVRTLIAKESPYVLDRKYILTTLSSNQATLARIEGDLNRLELDLARR